MQGVCSMFISAFSAYTELGRVSVTHLLFVAEIGFTIPDIFVQGVTQYFANFLLEHI
jgi:hypothetical protein